MKNKCFCLTFFNILRVAEQPFYYVRICKYAKLKFREADKCDITVLLYRKLLIFGFKWGTTGTFSPCAKSRNTTHFPCASDVHPSCVCVPCFFVEVCAANIVESTIVPFFRISPFAVSCSTTCEKSFSCSSFFEMAVFFTAPRSVVYWSSQYSCRHCSIFFLYSAGENPVTCLNCREKNFSSS